MVGRRPFRANLVLTGEWRAGKTQDHRRVAGEGQQHGLGSRGVAPDGANQVPDRGLDGKWGSGKTQDHLEVGLDHVLGTF